MRIGKHNLAPLTLAPMAGFGDVAFRRLCRDYGAGLTTTEMVSCKGLCYGNEKTELLLRLAPNESPSCVQLFGGEPEYFSRALAHPALNGFDMIDINMGCPVPKITKNGEGSALMLDVVRAAAIASAAVRAAQNRPVSVKFRLGWNDSTRNAVAFARAMQESGVSAVTVHGRTAEQAYRGLADWDGIASVAAAVKIPVIGNGDITNAGEAKRRMQQSGCAGVAVGRGALGNPGLFADQDGICTDITADMILRHLQYMLLYFPEKVAVREMRKHLVHYCKGVPGGKNLRAAANLTESAAELVLHVRRYLGSE